MNKADLKLTGEGVASIGRNALFLVSGNTINDLVRFVYMIALAKILGPQLYGIYKYAMSWYLAFLVITGMGLGTIMGREIGRNPGEGRDILSLTFSLQIVIVLVAAALCGVIGVAAEKDPEAARLIVALSFALVGRALAQWARWAFTAYEASRVYLILQAVYRPLEVILGLILLWFGGGVTAVVVWHGISWWLQAINAIALINVRLAPIRWRFVWGKTKLILAQGVPIGVGALLIYWLSQGALVLFRHTPAAEQSLGQFGLVMTAFGLVSGAAMTFSAASLPVLSRSVVRNDRKEMIYTELLFRVIIVFGSAVAVCLTAMGPWLVKAIFGASYEEAGSLIGPLAWVTIPWFCAVLLWGVYMAKGRFVSPMVILAAAAATLSFTLAPLVALWGAFGALVANGLGIAVWAVGYTAAFVKSGELRFGHAVLRPAVSAALAFFTYQGFDTPNQGVAVVAALTVLIVSAAFIRGLTFGELSVFGDFFRHRFADETVAK